MLLLAGPPRATTARRWDGTVVAGARLLVLVALGSGIVWLLVRTAVFENRPHAALEPRAVWHAVLDTWPGLVWLARHGLPVVRAALCGARGPSLLPRRADRDVAADGLGRDERARAGGEHRRPGGDDPRPLAPREARGARPDPRPRRGEPHAHSPRAVRAGRHRRALGHAAPDGARRAGSRARARPARAGCGDDADDARAPRRAGLAAAVPTLAGRLARRTGDPGA